MAYSREQLVLLALRWRGIPGAGQTPAAEDKAAIDEVLDGVMGDLAERDIYVWGDPDQTPDSAAVHLSVVLAWHAPDIGNMVQQAPTLEQAEARLRALKQVILSGQPQQTEYF
jgi:hypothetical protein